MKVECKSVQLRLGVFSIQIGEAKDEKGKTFLDLGAGIGPGLGLYYFDGHQNRDSFQPEARADIGFVKAGQASTSGGRSGWGIGLGAHFGAQGLIPL
jgi:hypothetical protein